MAGKSESLQKVIWVEDQPDHLTAAQRLLGRRGWQVTIECDIVEAARRLANEVFHALIMDLMVPSGLGGNSAAGYRIWSTYRLLCWLGSESTRSMTDARAGLSGQWLEIDELRPLDANMHIPAMILSAYHDEGVANAMKAANRARTNGQEMVLCVKPIEAIQVVEELQRLMNQVSSA